MIPVRVTRTIATHGCTLVFAACACLGAAAGDAPAQGQILAVRDAWVRATVEGQTGSGAYMSLTSREAAQLVGVSSPVANRVEIHEMRQVGNMMTMRRIESLPLPANTTVALEHEYHIMLIGLKHQLLTGQDVPLTLLLDAGGTRRTIDVLAPVRALNTAAPGPSAP